MQEYYSQSINAKQRTLIVNKDVVQGNAFYLSSNLALLMITAEVVPVPQRRAEAATALRRAGFQVLSVGESITITADMSLFESFFKIKLVKQQKEVIRGLPESARAEFLRPEKPPIIPRSFTSLIKDVVFPEPPEYF